MSVIILHSNTGAKVIGADVRAVQIISDTLAYDVEGAAFRAGFRHGTWNGKKSFARVTTEHGQTVILFEAGFVDMVKRSLSEAGIPVAIRDLREPIPMAGKDFQLEGITWRDYQVGAIEAFAQEGHGILQLATGAGKTEIGIGITKLVGQETLWLTHKLDLVRQTRKRYQARLGRAVGMISEGEWMPSDITVATVQTIMAHWTKIWRCRGKRKIVDQVASTERYRVACKKARENGEDLPKESDHVVYLKKDGRLVTEIAEVQVRGLTDQEAKRDAERNRHFHDVELLELVEDRTQKVIDYLKRVKLIIIDEAHRASGDNFFKIVTTCTNAFYRCALTATALMKGNREDDLRLIATCGNVIYRITNKDLIEAGVLAQPFFTFAEVPSFRMDDDTHPRLATYAAVYSKGIVNNPVRNQIVLEETRFLVEAGRKTVVLVREVKHGRVLQQMMRDDGIRCRWVSGKDDADDRELALKALREGEIDVLIASTILDEGLDEPSISAIVLAGGGKSKISLFQRVGRGARQKKGEDLERFGNTSEIIDFVDTGDKRLMKHSALRFKAVKDEEGWIIKEIVHYSDRPKRLAAKSAARSAAAA